MRKIVGILAIPNYNNGNITVGIRADEEEDGTLDTHERIVAAIQKRIPHGEYYLVPVGKRKEATDE
jgi:hypothetical protein